MRKYFENVIKTKKEKLASIRSAIESSQDVNEIRSLTKEAEAINEELREAEAKLAEVIKDEEERSTVPANAQLVNGQIRASFGTKEEKREAPENYFDSMEYRKAFMAFVQRGEPIVRAGQVISSQDTGAAIPITIMQEVINTVRKRYGNLYNKVRKLNIKGGVEFPVGALQATFKWITESTVSPRQKVGTLGKVAFSYYTAEIRIAQSFLSSILTMDAFEAKIAEVIAIAYLQAMDEGIMKGTGDGQMTGILNDPRVTNTVEMTAADFNNWTSWRKKFFAKLPLGYRSGEFIFPVSTVDTYLETMADANNNPVFRQATGLEVNDGDAQNPDGRFFGRDISLVEPDILPDFDTAEAGDVIGVFWQPQEYAINENFGFTMRKYFDEETNEWVNKALVVLDGKALNPTGFYLIKKKAS